MTKTARILKAYRKRHGLTQAQAAKRIGCAQSAVCCFETGKRKPRALLAARIERVCAK